MGYWFRGQRRRWFRQNRMSSTRELEVGKTEKQNMQICLCTWGYRLFQKPVDRSVNAVLHAEYCTRRRFEGKTKGILRRENGV